MVGGINMDKLFTEEQIVPTTAPPTTGGDANIASIANSMSSISNKSAAQSADNDKERPRS